MSETIAAIYKTQAQVRARCRTLDRVSASSIDRHMQGGSYLGESSSLETRPVESKGFWASLFGGETYDDTRVYDENLTSGGSVVTVRAVSDADYERVAAILDRHDPVAARPSSAVSCSGDGLSSSSLPWGRVPGSGAASWSSRHGRSSSEALRPVPPSPR